MSLPLTGSKTCVLPREIASRQERFTRETLVPTLFSPTLVTIDGVKSHGLIFFDFFFLSADTVLWEDSSQTKYLMSGEMGVRKAANTVPHDIGDPGNTSASLVIDWCMHDLLATFSLFISR